MVRTWNAPDVYMRLGDQDMLQKVMAWRAWNSWGKWW